MRTAGRSRAFDERAHKIDKHQSQVDIDDEVAGQQWDRRVSLQTNVTASVLFEKRMLRFDESSSGRGAKASCNGDGAPQPHGVAIS
jgi:hypothetical protein